MSDAGPGLVAAGLLGRQVRGRAEHRADLRDAGLLGRLRDPEVGELRHARLVRDQQVAGLHVAVDDARAVGVVEPVAGVAHDRDRSVDVELLVLAQQVRARRAVDVLHDDVVAAAGGVLPESKTCTMFGCWSRAAASASRRKRATKPRRRPGARRAASPRRAARARCRGARKTVDMPPAPRRRSSGSGRRRSCGVLTRPLRRWGRSRRRRCRCRCRRRAVAVVTVPVVGVVGGRGRGRRLRRRRRSRSGWSRSAWSASVSVVVAWWSCSCRSPAPRSRARSSAGAGAKLSLRALRTSRLVVGHLRERSSSTASWSSPVRSPQRRRRRRYRLCDRVELA